mgnify:CR=1 FL=1
MKKRILNFQDFFSLSDCGVVPNPVPSVISDSMVQSEPQDINFNYVTDVESELLDKFFLVFYFYTLNFFR